jgi:HAD superfamily hydrolase (TIGR01509 family)
MSSTNSTVKGVFFDLYGTLLIYGDMERAWSAWFEALLAAFSQSLPNLAREDLALACEGFFSSPEPDVCQDGLTAYERRLQRVASQLGGALSPKVLGEGAAASVEVWEEYITLDPVAVSVLSILSQQKVPLALITNFDHPPHIHRLLERLDLRRFFDVVTVSAEVGLKKPDPKIFGPALEATGLAPESVIFVGDSDDDVGAAINCGMQPVLIRRPGSPSENARTGNESHANNDPTEKSTNPGVIVIADLRELLDLV